MFIQIRRIAYAVIKLIQLFYFQQENFSHHLSMFEIHAAQLGTIISM